MNKIIFMILLNLTPDYKVHKVQKKRTFRTSG